MESFRFILALVLCFAIIVTWNVFLGPKPQPPPPGGGEARPAARVEEGPRAPAPAPAAPPGPEAPKAEPAKPEVTEEIKVDGDGGKERLRLKVTNRGGIDQVLLPRYEARDGKGPMVLIPETGGLPLLLGSWVAPASVVFRKDAASDLPNWDLQVLPGAATASLAREVDGVRVTKEVEAIPGHYHAVVSVTFENLSTEDRPIHYRIRGPSGLTSESLRGPGTDLNLIYGEPGAEGEMVNEVTSVTSLKMDWSRDRVVLVGSSNNYFAGVLAARDKTTSDAIKGGFGELVFDPRSHDEVARKEFGKAWDELGPEERKKVEEKAYRNVVTGLVSKDNLVLKPGAKLTHQFLLFLGPRDPEVFAEYPELNLVGINYYGLWTPLVRVFLLVLKAFHWVFNPVVGARLSWGLAIMALTCLVRLCLHPVNRKQQISMMRYQKKVSAIKPEMDAIKERHAANRMKMNQEMQRLFKEHQISPLGMMGGCMMIFLQLPVWYALYGSIEVSLDLRRAPFLWIGDLTQPDHLLSLPFTIPLLGTNAINILPVIYVCLTILQQKMQPKPADPQMQQQMKIMTFMLLFFGFIFYSFPAGFLLYFITSAAVAILESRIIKRMLAHQGLVPVPAGAGGSASAASVLPTSTTFRSSAMYPARKSGDRKADDDKRKRKG